MDTADNYDIVIAGAGCLKAGSGYAFQFIQHQSDEIIRLLKAGRVPLLRRPFFYGRFRFYDATFLSVIQQTKPGFPSIIRQLFQQLPAPLILKFLENKTNLGEELKVISIFPPRRFLPAALKILSGK